jgi:GntR family transcriptional regulator, transcriptional repressor for pyruvate dehydrogenase complex
MGLRKTASNACESSVVLLSEVTRTGAGAHFEKSIVYSGIDWQFKCHVAICLGALCASRSMLSGRLRYRIAGKKCPHAIGGTSKVAAQLKPIQPQKLYVIAANRLAEQIKAGVWTPGARLPSERELSDTLGISRASVREALRALESIGILYSKRGAGHFVAEQSGAIPKNEALISLVDQGDPQELMEARRALEPEVARLAAIYRDIDDLERLYEALERMQQLEADNLFEEYLEADFEFHLLIGYATHNPVVIDLERVIIERMKAPAWKAAAYTIVPKNRPANRQQHAEILAAIMARKPKDAYQAMLNHLAHVARNLRNISSFQEVMDFAPPF